MKTQTCKVCGKSKLEYVCGQMEPRAEGSEIFGHFLDGTVICEPCAAQWERDEMTRTGKATLYLTFPGMSAGIPKRRSGDIYHDGSAHVGNWTGALRFKLYPRIVVGRQNFAGSRYDVWFNGPDGFVWHGVQYGEFTQLCHCKRTKERYRVSRHEPSQT